MSATITKSLATDFGGNLNSDVLEIDIANDPAITTTLLGITTAGDVVDIIFATALSASELTALDTLISNYVFIPYANIDELAIIETTNPTVNADNKHGYVVGARWINTVTRREFACVSNATGAAAWKDIADKGYDAIVDITGKGDYTSIAAAFAGGATSVYLRAGTYVEMSDIVLPDGGVLVGEGPARPLIFFALGNSIICDAIGGATIHTNGTISVVSGSATVSGTGTTFTAIGVGLFILIGQTYYRIVAVASDVELTIEDPYNGSTLTNVSYRAHALYSGVTASNFIIMNSASNGLLIRGTRHSVFERIAAKDCATSFRIEDSSADGIDNLASQNTSSHGIVVHNSYAIGLSDTTSFNSQACGMLVSGDSECIILSSCQASNNMDAGFNFIDTASNIVSTDCIARNNATCGFHSAATTSTCSMTDCIIGTNASHGVDLEGAENTIQGNIITDSGGSGIRIGSGNIISANHSNNNAGYGIEMMNTGNEVSDNNINGNGNHGILCAGSCTIIGNSATGNAGDGFHINAISGCNLTGNTADSNTGIGFNILGAASLINVCSNRSVGHTVGISAVSPASGVVIGINNVVGATGNGITCSANASMITANRSANNGGWGVQIPAGTIGTMSIVNQSVGNTLGTELNEGTIPGLEPLRGDYLGRSDIFAAVGSTNQTTYSRISDYVFPGLTGNRPPLSFEVSAFMDATAISYDIRIYDFTNAVVIAEKTGNTNETKAIIDLGTISNLPAAAAIFEIQIAVGNGAGSCYLTGMVAKYY